MTRPSATKTMLAWRGVDLCGANLRRGRNQSPRSMIEINSTDKSVVGLVVVVVVVFIQSCGHKTK